MTVSEEVIAAADFIRHRVQYGNADYYRDFDPKTGQIKWWCPIEAIIVTHLLHLQLENDFATKKRLGLFTNQMSS